MSNICHHGTETDLDNNLGCVLCMMGVPVGPTPLPDGIREEYLEQALGFILRQSMHDEGGDQVAGVATALKRTWVAAFKTGQSCPATSTLN